jgi:hypothetical protein
MWVIGTSDGPKYTRLQNMHNLEKQMGKIIQISFDRYGSGTSFPKHLERVRPVIGTYVIEVYLRYRWFYKIMFRVSCSRTMFPMFWEHGF